MPSANEVKQYVEGAYYHIYNRGVEKRNIFQNQQDYGVFLSYLKTYLLPKDEKFLSDRLSNPNLSPKERDMIIKTLRMNNFADEIALVAYCLMPNHFHLLVKQKDRDSIDKFMNSLGTRYTMYFNKKYQRVGPLYQGTYKAILVSSDEQLLHLTRYIHQNPLRLVAFQGDPLEIQPSSYLDYIGKRRTSWIKHQEILAYFSKTNPKLSYKAFMETSEDLQTIESLAIDN